MNNYNIEPEVWRLLSQRVIHTLQTYGWTPAVQRAVRFTRARVYKRVPYWLRNGNEHQDTFDEDYAEYQKRQWEKDYHD